MVGVFVLIVWSLFVDIPQASSSGTNYAKAGDGIENTSKTFFPILQEFFCQSTACKHSRKKNSDRTAKAAAIFRSEVLLVIETQFPTRLDSIARKWSIDTQEMLNALFSFRRDPVDASAVSNYNTIYFEGANMTSDSYLFQCKRIGARVNFELWNIGVNAILRAMNNEESVVKPNSPVNVSIEVSNSVLQEAQVLATDANGPNRAYNSLVALYAHNWEFAAEQTTLLFEFKPAKLTPNQLSTLSMKLTKELDQIHSMQKRLIG